MVLEKEYIKKTSLQHRKKYAQFFTPLPIAKFMTNWILEKKSIRTLLEPAFGLGIFTRLILEKKENIKIKGFDVDKVIYQEAKENFKDSNIELYLEDYLYNDWENRYDAIICNPPYQKFHDYSNLDSLKEIKKRLKINLSGFTNIYILFLLKSIYQLNENGRMAYIVPSEFLNSNYGEYVKKLLIQEKVLKSIVVFDFKESIFEQAITTSCILLLEKDLKNSSVDFFKINEVSQLNNLDDLEKKTIPYNDIVYNKKWKFYYQKQNSVKYKHLISFNSIARVKRGIATGANKYFIFNIEKAQNYRIDFKYLLPCITASRDIKLPIFTKSYFEDLKENNKNVFLFNGLGTKEIYVAKYIQYGELQGIHCKYLTSKRRPWYKLENREPAPILVSVFNRKGLKFIRNEAMVRTLSTFHCIYVQDNLLNKINIDLLFAYLLTDISKEIFDDEAREYGNGLKKFEPNDLNNAKMLNIFELGNNYQSQILELYNQYRDEILKKNIENNTYIKEIDRILKNRFQI
jgi:adenine-specific DNA-methyltransferase